MKLLADARTLGTAPTGVGMYLYNFINTLSDTRNMEILLLTDVAESRELEMLRQKKIRILAFGKKIHKKPLDLLRYFRFVQSSIYTEKPDIFWEVNNLFPVRLQNPSGKIVTTIHDVFPLTMKEGYGRVYPLYFRRGICNTLRYTDAILYNSEDTQHETERLFPKAAKIPHTVSYIIIHPLPELPVTDENFFLYVGNLELRKGTDLLIDAYLKYLDAGGNKDLILGGKVRDAVIQQKLDLALQKTKKLRYIGYVEQNERNRFYASCSAFVFPSRAEGFGMPVVEALYYQKHLILTDLPIFREIIGDTAETVPLSDHRDIIVNALTEKLLSCTGSPDKDQAKRITERYLPKPLTEKLLHFFQSLSEGSL